MFKYNRQNLILALTLLLPLSTSLKAEEIPWTASPDNWTNSPYNFDNSPLNFNNSLNNYENTPESPKRRNILNSLGFVVGYATIKADGGINYFDNDGERIGYTPPGVVTEKLGGIAYSPEGKPITVRIEEKD